MTTIVQAFHEDVAARLIALLEQGTAPWQTPWQPGMPDRALPMNPVTGKRYRGINAIGLMSHAHADPRWMTYRQAAAIGAAIRKGETGTPIQYWQFSQEQAVVDARGNPMRDDQGRPLREMVPLERPQVFLATVYHASQIDGLAPLPLHAGPAWPSLERPERIVQDSGATISHRCSRSAYYSPATDTIHLPDKALFPSAAHYYATALHELGHWSGHASRLDRDLAHPFGSQGYAREELRAEMASMFLGAELGIGHDPRRHAAYARAWIALLRNDPLEIFRAAADAEKISGFVLKLAQVQAMQQASDWTRSAEGRLQQPGGVLPAEERLASALGAVRRGPGDTTGAAHAVQRPGRTFLAVPFDQRAEAKALGARWDRAEHAWYMPAGVDAGPFARWMPLPPIAEQDGRAVTEKPGLPVPARVYLAVPFAARDLARKAGAVWDPIAKSWYAGAQADMAQLAPWQLAHQAQWPAPAIGARDEFAAALREQGLVVSGAHPVMDGRTHRVPVEGGKPGALDGFYVGHLDHHPAGRIINYKTGADATWHSKGYAVSREHAAALHAQARATLAAREAEQAQRHRQTAQRIAVQIAQLLPLQAPTAYLQRKGVGLHPGVLTGRDRRLTVVPGFDADGMLWTLQTIGDDGAKRFVKDSRKAGCLHVVGGLPALTAAPALVIAEGYATAASLSQALGFATVAAFDAGNLQEVALALQRKFPGKPVIIAGDDDRHLEVTHGKNRGKAAAREAAAATGGHWLLPVFAPGEGSYPADLPPITPAIYRDHLRTGTALHAAQLSALDQMKRYTDFNDLATASRLGPEAIVRQVHAFVAGVLAVHPMRTDPPAQRLPTMRRADVRTARHS